LLPSFAQAADMRPDAQMERRRTAVQSAPRRVAPVWTAVANNV
jgi:hypothetical protein